MTISTTSNRLNFTATAGQVNFDYTFPCYDKTHMLVYVNAVLKTVDIDYTIDLALKRVTFMVAPGAGVLVILVRQVPLKQLTDYVAHDSFPAETHERALDLGVMMAQQMNEVVNRVVRVPITSLLNNLDLPEGADKGIKWNSAGTGLDLFTIDANSTSVITTQDDIIIGDASGLPSRIPLATLMSTKMKLDDLTTPDDNTDLNVSATRHGLCPKVPNDASQALLGTGVFGVPSALRGHYSNLKIENAGGVEPSMKQIVITADSVVLLNADNLGYQATGVTVVLDLSTTGANGLDTGSITNATWYFVWLIYNGATVASLASLSSTAPTLPGGYTYKRLVGSVRNIGMINQLHMDGADQGTTFTDESGKSWTPYNHAKTVTGQKKFGTASAQFDGVDDYIDTIDVPDYDFGRENFTVECWFKRGAIGTAQEMMGKATNGGLAANIEWAIYFDAGNNLVGYFSDGTTLQTVTHQTTVAETTTWHHVALVRNGYKLLIFLDGVICTTPLSINLDAGINATAGKLAIGRMGEYTSNYFNGYIDEVAIIRGLAKYTATFTPATAAYANRIQIRPFTQIGNEVIWKTTHNFIVSAGNAASLTSVDVVKFVPSIANKIKGLYGSPTSESNTGGVYLASGSSDGPSVCYMAVKTAAKYMQVGVESWYAVTQFDLIYSTTYFYYAKAGDWTTVDIVVNGFSIII